MKFHLRALILFPDGKAAQTNLRQKPIVIFKIGDRSLRLATSSMTIGTDLDAFEGFPQATEAKYGRASARCCQTHR